MESCAVGRVIREIGTRAEVEVDRQEGCSHCSTADLCNSLGSRGRLRIEVDNPLGARVGALVELTSQRPLGLRAAFFVYLVPTVFLIGGLIVGAQVLRWPVWASGLLGLAGLGSAIGIAKGFERQVTRGAQYRLAIARIVPEPPPPV